MTDNLSRTDLFSPVTLGALALANRIVMAPLTRSRMGGDGVPNALHAEYYAQRASAGLIISEATNISPQARGYALTPGSTGTPPAARCAPALTASKSTRPTAICSISSCAIRPTSAATSTAVRSRTARG